MFQTRELANRREIKREAENNGASTVDRSRVDEILALARAEPSELLFVRDPDDYEATASLTSA